MSRAAYTAGIDWKARLKDGMYELTGFVGGSRVEGDSLAMQRLQRSSARYFQRPDQTYVTYDPHQTSLSGYRCWRPGRQERRKVDIVGHTG